MLTGADGVVLTGADGVVLTGADGVVLTGADGVVLTGADGVVLTGADAVTYTGVDGVVLTGADSTGLQGFDPDLAILLGNLPDSSAINVFVIFHRLPTESDLQSLRQAGIIGGIRFYNLPMVLVNATKGQIEAISQLPSVRSIYSNKTCQFFTNDTRLITGQRQVITDRVLANRNNGVPMAGQGQTVAVLDTGIDATHPDLSYGAQVVQNVRALDLQSVGVDFLYPNFIEGLANTDLTMGHGTFVASVIAGTGAASGGHYGGIAPASKVLGVSAGDASLLFVLSGIDYILSNRVAHNIRVINCSFGINGVFDAHDPVNIATKIMHDAGIAVVFSAGNRGDQPNALNPYAVAPWVIGVGAGTKDKRLAAFSSRGAAAYGMFHPTLVAPGQSIVAARATGINLIGTTGLIGGLIGGDDDLQTIPPAYLAHYTSSSGTSFAAPHVAATVALMLQANPRLTPSDVKRILQETATAMTGYSRYEVGAGYLNTYAAVRRAAFQMPFGQFRGQMNNEGVSIARHTLGQFAGDVAPGASYTRNIALPTDAVYATVQTGWVETGAVNDLDITVSNGSQSFESRSPMSLIGGGFRKTGVSINEPAAGRWTITVKNNGVRSQRFIGSVEIIRATYLVSGLDSLSPAEQIAAKRALRTGLLAASGSFSGSTAARRAEIARALMLGAHVPQFLPYTPTFSDMNDRDALYIESVTSSPYGNLLGATGSRFNPQGQADRLMMAVAAVKALGLANQAQSEALNNPGLADWNLIPTWARGYVSIAVSRGLMTASNSGHFRPFDAITRVELATSAVALQQAAR